MTAIALLSNVKHNPIYTISEIAAALGPGWTVWRVKSLLSAKQIAMSKEGNKNYVFLSAIERACPELAASILDAKRLSELSGLRVVAVYTCSQIARMCGSEWNNDRVRRMLKHHNVPTWLHGNKYYVFLSSLQEVFPELWNSLLQARASVEDDEDDEDEAPRVYPNKHTREPYARAKRPDRRHSVD